MIKLTSSTIQTFRALSGSQYIFFTSKEPEPPGITNKVVMFETLSDQSVTYQAKVQANIKSEVIWSWNGQDISQFESTVTRLSGGFTSANLNVETTSEAPLGSYLLMSGSGSGQGTAVWFANEPLPSTNFIIEAAIETIGQYDSGTPGNQYGGIALLGSGSGTDCHCLCILRNNNGTGTQARFDGAITSITSSTFPLGKLTPSKLVIECIAGKQTGSVPTFSIKVFSNGNDGNDVFTCGYDTNWSPTWGGNWLNIPETDLNRWGLVVQTPSSTQNPYIRFSYIVIRRHPIDEPENS